MSQRLRCAIYTRKSTEEGLDQNFNSLHAQREACEAYILSQVGEGWTPIKTAYDDGGFSGGNMLRPGLKQLLSDIDRGLVDIVVVYKVDRLTRALSDFAKIVDAFDGRGVSFVSVTQAFNTTTSMGRLTLNVLLSFAQFEREVTGERIRDKVAASKAKGMRMGGRPPLGYDIVDGRLALNAAEAVAVQRIFGIYLQVGSVRDLQVVLERENLRAKCWTNLKGGVVGGGRMSRGALHYLLRNPAYRGVTRHKEKRYDATHPAIIDQQTWDTVQAQIGSSNGSRPSGETRPEPALLSGRLFDDRGHPMAPVHTTRGPKRYRYYESRPKGHAQNDLGSVPRIAAGVIETFLIEQLQERLSASWNPSAALGERVATALQKITLGEDQVLAVLNPNALADGCTAIALPIHLRRRQGAIILQAASNTSVVGKPDRALVRAIVLASVWAKKLESGACSSIKELARSEGLCNHYTSRLLPLAYLAPDLVETILSGRQSRAMTLKALTAKPLPLSWGEQRDLVSLLG